MSETVTRRYNFALYPNKGQAAHLEDWRRRHCRLWNALIEQRRDAWDRCRVSLSCFDQQKEITALRASDPYWREMNCDSQHMTAKRVQQAYDKYFANVKAGLRNKFGGPLSPPGYRKGEDYPGFTYRPAGWKLAPKDGGKSGKMRFADIGWIKYRGCFPPGVVDLRTCDVLLVNGKWFASVVVTMEPRRKAGKEKIKIGMDLIEQFAVIDRENRADAPPDADAADENSIAETSNLSRKTGVSGGSPAESLHLQAERRFKGVKRFSETPAESLHLQAERRTLRDRVLSDDPAASPESRAERRRARYLARFRSPAASPENEDRTQARLLCPAFADSCGDPAFEDRTQVLFVPPSRRGDPVYAGKGPVRGKINRKKIERAREIRRVRRKKDAIHKATTAIVAAAKVIDLTKPASIKAATQSGKGTTRRWGAMVKTKAALNRHILDQNPAFFIDALTYKAAEAGVDLTVTEIEDHEITVGNKLVESAKSVRAAKRTVKRKDRSNERFGSRQEHDEDRYGRRA